MEKKKRLVLINPGNPVQKGFLRRQSLQPPLALAIVASLTPPEWKVRILDENFTRHEAKEADLVGLTCLTATAPRAYEIARIYRQKGIPVVLGGIHATLLSEEALQYVDCVVIGDAEATWPQILEDFSKGCLKKKYEGLVEELKGFPMPRFDLFHPGYIFGVIQTTRGCPMNCEFCSVPVMNQHKYRLRDVGEILDELAVIPHKLIYIVDDNLIGTSPAARKHAADLFQGMIDRNLGKEWFAYVSLNISKDEDLIRLAAASGCKMLLIGIESEKPEQLKRSNKKMNLSMGTESYHAVVRMIHRHGISVLGSFIFGMESDRVEDLRARVKYMLKMPFDIAQPNIMTPFPGTPLFDRMKAANRILCRNFPEDWKYFHGVHIIYHPEFIDPDTLEKEMLRVFSRLLSEYRLILRFIRTWWNTRQFRSAVWAYATNKTYQRIFRIKKDYLYR